MRLNTLRNWWQRRGINPDGLLFDKLHGSDRFRAILDVERQRVDRAGGAFTLAAFRFQSGQDDEFRLFAQFLQQRARATDHAGLMGERQVGVLLWDTDTAGARQFVESLARPGHPWTCPECVIYTYPHADREDDPKASESSEPDAGISGRNEHDAFQQLLQKLVKGSVADETNQEVPAALAVSGASPVADSRHSHRCNASVATAARGTEVRLSSGGETSGESPPSPAARIQVRPLIQLLVQPLPFSKRVIDLLAAGTGMLMLSPVLAAVAVGIKWTSPGPVLFLQRRNGIGGRPFTIYKFRTMCIDADAQKARLLMLSEQDGPAFKMTSDPRVTCLGRYLRKSCIDELPQLWNVLRGEMTLVGPRPLPCEEQAGCAQWQTRRLEVTPGLTCIWQVHGKSKVSFAEWMRMDIRYIQARTLLQDLRLIGETILAVVLHRASC
ncbi:MAG: sugar transferase [Planctomycetaceae bacterium]|nr:sugar transferase [Planctomycetaceae bacterium]